MKDRLNQWRVSNGGPWNYSALLILRRNDEPIRLVLVFLETSTGLSEENDEFQKMTTR